MYFEPMHLRRVTIAKALVTPIKQQVPVRIVNFSNTPYCINKNAILGHLYKPEEVKLTELNIENAEITGKNICPV
jgi:hypothetical protein